MRTDLLAGAAVDPHPARAQEILRRHPEIRRLFGRDPRTAAIAVGLVALQFGLAGLLWRSEAPWWAVVAAAWGFGAFVVHALFAVLHETTHDRVFRSPLANTALAVFANLPMLIPFAAPLAHYHRVHHRRMGQEQADPDLPTVWEVRRFAGLGKVLWMLLFPFLQLTRRADLDPYRWWNPKFIGGFVVQASVCAVLVASGAWAAIAYLLCSVYFVFSFHPLFGRFIQEHYVTDASQETSSYYGALNWVSLNLGYHAEHHDFPAVPWSRLDRLRRSVPEVYGEARSYSSWTRLWLEFLANPAWKVAGRLVRRCGEASLEP